MVLKAVLIADAFQATSEALMRTNVGTIDRIARVIVGLLLIAFAVPIGFPATGWNWIGWIGLVPVLTAVMGTCPLYSVLGLSTCSAKSAHHAAS